MLFVLGIGSNIAMCSCVATAIQDQFPKWKMPFIVIGMATVGFLIGLIYITPVSLVNFYQIISTVSIDSYQYITLIGLFLSGRSIHIEFSRFLWSTIDCIHSSYP